MTATWILIVLGLMAALLMVAALRPNVFSVSRAITIAAKPEQVFVHINELKRWEAWSPWARMDPQMQKEYSGPAAGVGAAQAWNGNRKVGAGRMEILDSQPPSRIAIQLEFLRPFKARNLATFELSGQDGATRVTWQLSGPANFITRLMGIFFSMDKMIGKDFEAGLAALKAVAER